MPAIPIEKEKKTATTNMNTMIMIRNQLKENLATKS